MLKLFPCLLTLLLMMTPQFALCESAKERFMEVLRSGVKDPELAEATLDYIDGVMSRRIKEEHSLPKETLGSLEKTIAKYLNSLREDNRSLTFSEDLKARIELRHLIYQVEFDGKQPIDQLWEAYEKLQYFEKQVCYLYLLKAYVAAADQLHQEREWTPENLGNSLKNQGFAIEPAEYPVSKKLFQMMAVTQEALDGDSISPPLRNAFEDLLYEWDRKVEIERKQMEQSLLENYFNEALLNKSMEWREWQNAYRYWRGNTPFVVAKEVPETVYKETGKDSTGLEYEKQKEKITIIYKRETLSPSFDSKFQFDGKSYDFFDFDYDAEREYLQRSSGAELFIAKDVEKTREVFTTNGDYFSEVVVVKKPGYGDDEEDEDSD